MTIVKDLKDRCSWKDLFNHPFAQLTAQKYEQELNSFNIPSTMSSSQPASNPADPEPKDEESEVQKLENRQEIKESRIPPEKISKMFDEEEKHHSNSSGT